MSFFLTDSHVHLQDPAFHGDSGSDLDDVLRRAKERGIERFFCNGTSPDDWDDVWKLADERKEIVPFFGLHPWYVDRDDDWEERLIHFVDKKSVSGRSCVGIGEIGLDYYVKPRNDFRQKEAFRIQLRLAKSRGLPVTVHSVRAIHEIIPILEAEGPFPAVLLHSFAGPADRIGQLVRLGCFFSFSATLL
ncbi:MAG: TatD family hydrolase, partial [Planctomycetaceae bacterium]|nr:TatD family hydrolase [Planctomycetaceae bacterium]